MTWKMAGHFYGPTPSTSTFDCVADSLVLTGSNITLSRTDIFSFSLFEAETRQKRCNFVSLFLFRCHCILHAQRDLAGFADFAAQKRRQAIEILRRDKFHVAFGELGFQAVQLQFEPG